MNQYILLKLKIGESLDINAVNAADDVYMYNYHTLITLGGIDDLIKMEVNGIMMELPSGVELTRIPLDNVNILQSTVSSTADEVGVLLIGQKSKRQLFG